MLISINLNSTLLILFSFQFFTMPKISRESKLSAVKQRFTLPEAFVFYVAKNPTSPKVYHKLIRCCKYFWLKNPIITLNSLRRWSNDEYWRTDKINGYQRLKRLHDNWPKTIWPKDNWPKDIWPKRYLAERDNWPKTFWPKNGSCLKSIKNVHCQ